MRPAGGPGVTVRSAVGISVRVVSQGVIVSAHVNSGRSATPTWRRERGMAGRRAQVGYILNLVHVASHCIL